MERHLGWFVGAAGAVLLGTVSPLLLLSQPGNGASGFPATPSTVSKSTHSSPAVASNEVVAQAVRDPMFTYHIRQAGVVASNAVGGGAVKKLAADRVKGQGVWQVYVNKPQEHWVITVSKHDYSVMSKVKLA